MGKKRLSKLQFKNQYVSKEKKGIKKWVGNNKLFLLAFFIPALFYIIACICLKVTPFGTQSLMVVDSLHQYLPFFSDYYEKLTKTHEFLYSWNSAMGYNFVTLWAYYLCSPFNFLILLFPQSMMNTAFTLIIGLKICCTSLTFTIMCAKKIGNKKDIRIVIFGLCYALSNYVIGYYWNSMWLDVLIWMPLVICALDSLIEKKQVKWYVITLFLAMCGNFYIGFMMCIFLVLWFLCYPHKNIKTFFFSGLRFAGGSLLAAGMGSALFIPAYKGLMMTGQADTEFPEWSWYGNIFDILTKQQFNCGAITNQSFDGGINLYCGILSLYLVVIYFFMREFSIWQKLRRMLLLAMLLISFNNTWLNYVWHGFHDQFGIPNRFSFLYIFVVLYMSFEVIMNLEHIKFYHYFIPMAVMGGVLIYNEVGTEIFTDSAVLRANILIMTGYFVFFVFAAAFEWKEQVIGGILLLAVAAELIYNGASSWNQNGQVDAAYYFSDEKQMREAIDSNAKDTSWHREELSKNKLVDENTYYNLPSIGVFGSTANGDAVTLLGKMGFYTAANEFLYNGATPLTDSLFGVKYLYKRSTDYYDHMFQFKDNIKSIEVYENPYALSVGYLVSDKIYDWNYESGNIGYTLNDLVNCGVGTGDIFTSLPDTFSMSSDNCDTYWGGNYDYHYTRTSQDGNIKVTLSYVVDTDEPVFINATGTNFETMDVYVNGELTNSGRLFFQMMYAGPTKKGDTISVDFNYNSSAADEEYITCKAYSFNHQAFEKAYDKFSENQIQITKHSSSNIEGTIDASYAGTVMTSIVADPGWSIYVDGKKQDTYEIGDAFISFDMEKGTHKIKMSYFPPGLKEGIVISAFSLVIFVMIFIVKRKNKDIISKENMVS